MHIFLFRVEVVQMGSTCLIFLLIATTCIEVIRGFSQTLACYENSNYSGGNRIFTGYVSDLSAVVFDDM